MDLLDLRKQIDDIDEQLIPLLLKRMQVSKDVAQYKIDHGIPVLNEKREREILDDVKEKCGAEGDTIATVFSAIMDASRALQHKIIGGGDELRKQILQAVSPGEIVTKSMLVACAGVDGSYADITAHRLFKNASIKHYKMFEDVFDSVYKNEVPFGVIPVENSTAGSVHDAYDLIMKYRFYVVASLSLGVSHCFCAAPGVSFSDINDVYSHPQALAQCSKFMKDFGFTGVNHTNTAAAAKYAAENPQKKIGVICSEDAAKKYNLVILRHNIQNIQNNRTRFIVISKKMIIENDADKISLIFSVPHISGSLYRVLGRFSMAGLNLTKLESRPTGTGNFEYIFYTDLEGNVRDEQTLDLICALSSELPNFKFLGSYREF